jgi:hypothetical protein
MAQLTRLVRKKLAEVLLEEGVVKDDQIQEALKRQRATGEFLTEALVQLNYCTELDVARSIVKQFGLPYIDVSKYRIPREALQAVPSDLLQMNQVVVLDKIGKTLLVASAGVPGAEILERLERGTGSQVFLYVCTISQLAEAYKKHLAGGAKPAAAVKK